MTALNIVMRSIHILSGMTLVGGAIALRLTDRVASVWRSIVIAAVIGILISGVWNYSTKAAMPPAYQAVFGIKFLLALHVMAVSILAARPENKKRTRLLTGVVFSGVTIVVLSEILRWLSLR